MAPSNLRTVSPEKPETPRPSPCSPFPQPEGKEKAKEQRRVSKTIEAIFLVRNASTVATAPSYQPTRTYTRPPRLTADRHVSCKDMITSNGLRRITQIGDICDDPARAEPYSPNVLERLSGKSLCGSDRAILVARSAQNGALQQRSKALTGLRSWTRLAAITFWQDEYCACWFNRFDACCIAPLRRLVGA